MFFAIHIPVWISGFASEPLPIFDKNDDKFLLLLYSCVIIVFAMILLCRFITGISIDVSLIAMIVDWCLSAVVAIN